MMAPTAVVWSVVLAVFERVSRGWKVRWSAMAGEIGRRCRLASSPDVGEVGCGSMRETSAGGLACRAASSRAAS
jgi:hypothetical protein